MWTRPTASRERVHPPAATYIYKLLDGSSICEKLALIPTRHP